jgi:hypothetical protein
VKYAYEILNDGNAHLHNIHLTDDQCPAMVFLGGDDDHDGAIDLPEIWKYSCEMTLDRSTTNIATVTAEQDGKTLTDTAELFVPVAEESVLPSIALTIAVTPDVILESGGDMTFTYTVTNSGNTHLTDIALVDNGCLDIFLLSGDGDNDRKLDTHEVWKYACTKAVTEKITETARASGRIADLTVTDDASLTVKMIAEGRDVHSGEGQGVSLLTSLGLPLHGLVKVPEKSTVYYLGADGLAHPFLNERSFFTWNCDYRNLSIISESLFAQIHIGAPVNFAPGVFMVKRPEDPKVYALEKGSVLRWITSEEVGKALYGENWNKQIIDLFSFDGYTLGKDIEQPDAYDPILARQAVTYPSDGLGIDEYVDSPPSSGLRCIQRQSKR